VLDLHQGTRAGAVAGRATHAVEGGWAGASEGDVVRSEAKAFEAIDARNKDNAHRTTVSLNMGLVDMSDVPLRGFMEAGSWGVGAERFVPPPTTLLRAIKTTQNQGTKLNILVVSGTRTFMVTGGRLGGL
jgi:hypothetical protein